MSRFSLDRRAVVSCLLACVALTVLPVREAGAEQTIHIVDAKARPTAPGVKTGVVYMVIMNHGTADDAVSSVSTPVAENASVHRTTNENGIMKMEPVPSLPIKAGGGVTLEPKGLHIMLEGLKQPLKLGDTFPVTLNFDTAGAVTTTVTVAPIKADKKNDMDSMPGMKM